MADLKTEGLNELIASLDRLSGLSDGEAEKMLAAEAEVLMEGQKQTGRSMGVHRTGVTLDSISHTGLKTDREGKRAMYVTFNGVNAQGNRNAEVAFINEFGRKNMKARPFIRTANQKYGEAAVKKAEEEYDKILKETGY